MLQELLMIIIGIPFLAGLVLVFPWIFKKFKQFNKGKNTLLFD